MSLEAMVKHPNHYLELLKSCKITTYENAEDMTLTGLLNSGIKNWRI